MSILDRLIPSRRRKALKAPRLARNAAEHTSVDRWLLDDLKRQSPVFAQALETPIKLDDGREYEPSADVHDDIFLAAHTPGDSRVKHSEEVRPSHRFGRDVLDAFVKTEAHRDSKVHTTGDAVASAIYTRAAIAKFDELMGDEAVREQREKSQELQDREQALDQVVDMLADARAAAKALSDAGEPIPQALADDVKSLVQQREQAASELADAADQLPATPDATRVAAEESAQAGKERAELWGQLAGFADGALDRVTPDDAWDLAESWMNLPDFREIVKLMGRMIRDFRTQDAKNVIGGNDEIVGIEHGNNLTNTLPVELARLGSPLTQRSFIRDFVDEELLQFQTQGSERVALGPGVLCLDVSPSMNSANKLLHAKGVVLGYVRLMHRKKRDAVVIAFESNVVWEHHFKRGEPLDMAKLLELASLKTSGGTNITRAVARAEQYLKRASDFKRADLLVTTDGQSPFGDEAVAIRERLRETGVRSLGIGIGHTPAEGGWLLSFCDHAISVAQLTEATADIVRAVS